MSTKVPMPPGQAWLHVVCLCCLVSCWLYKCVGPALLLDEYLTLVIQAACWLKHCCASSLLQLPPIIVLHDKQCQA